jgi:RDD family
MALILRPAGGAGAAIFTSAAFALIFFYDVLFEVLGGGRTPGKRVSGLRVVRSGGRPITFSRSALRNILRLIDILPGMYAVGMTVMFISSRNQRVGDLAAGTYVVRVRHGDPPRGHRYSERPEIDTTPAQAWDVTAITAEDVATVRAFLERRYDLQDDSRRAIGGELSSRLRPRVGGVQSGVTDEQFLELLAAVKTR